MIIYDIHRFIQQLDKGNPNITEFLLYYQQENDTENCWSHPLWKEFMESFRDRLITSNSVKGIFVSVQQEARKLNRGENVSKRQWKKKKQPPTPAHLLPFPEDKLSYTNIIRFVDMYMTKRNDNIDYNSLQMDDINWNTEFSLVMSNIRDSEDKWSNILPIRFIDEKSSNLDKWIHTVFETIMK